VDELPPAQLQRRATAPGEDHNPYLLTASDAAACAQRRATTPGEDHNSGTIRTSTSR